MNDIVVAVPITRWIGRYLRRNISLLQDECTSTSSSGLDMESWGINIDFIYRTYNIFRL
jgi:hypothetical protein